ncbi:Voltage-gated Ion Channel (VIC) Superfamily [Phytophthora infestans T30-4]|uniref:Voltage-gated Ion Channel (VIC) Superfamily n=1 Tax=Phytophthora infestans (strain T30-4) TaxID=403677 RepID=D0N415_PHYIT|nr:Voltage-gated Ion Channel (VIC) Superfamily [Phytophthora infestans T30-4]EEY69119.1 Voltage-gated Ion Channel (VIC) Superfamily [Phytophthora infestans T30-4]|eukprot:XP_002998973.1 Voltage-gated Ion Channel (VIC) Superfamily [Phytophthora infestans T30-4]
MRSARRWKRPVVRDLLRKFSKRMRRAIKRRMKGESRRQWIERNLHDSEVGVMLDVVQCILSFVMVIAMIKLNWKNPDTNFTIGYLAIDTINLVATLANFGLRFYSASNRRSFLLHWLSVVEMICVLPLLVEFTTGTTDSIPHTHAFRLLMMLRVMRLLQFYRLLRLAKSAKLRQGLLICLTTLCVIMCGGIFMQTIEYCDPVHKGTQISGETCQDMTFLDAIYFVCITIATVGFGDVAPKTNLGKAFDVALIFFAGALIPIQISGYSYILSRETAFDKKYEPDKSTQHVLLCGEVENGALLFFLHNWLHKDEERRTRRKVVILAPTLPSNDLRRVLLHPDYEERVIYLQGSAMVAADLQRAAAPTAEYCFVMVKKHSGTLDQNDTAANLITCSVRKNNRHAPLHVQVSKFDNTRHFHISGATAVICLEQLKLAFFGKCLWIRGLNPFFGNLIHKFSHTEECRGYWLSDYLSGCEQKICEAALPPFLLNMPSYRALAVLFYREFGVPLVGLRTIEDTTAVYPVDEQLSDGNFLSVFFIGRGNDIASKIEKMTPAIFARHADIAPASLGMSANRNIRTVATILTAAIENKIPFGRRVSVGFGRDRRISSTPDKPNVKRSLRLSMFSGRAMDKIAPVDREDDEADEQAFENEETPTLPSAEDNRLDARRFTPRHTDSNHITRDENYSLGNPSDAAESPVGRPSKPVMPVIALTPAELVKKATTPRGRTKDPVIKPLSSRMPLSARSARSTVERSTRDQSVRESFMYPNDSHASNWEPAPLLRPSVAASGNLRSRIRHMSLCFRRDPPPITLSDHYVVCGTPSNYEDFLANLSDLNEKVSGVIFITQRQLTEKDFMAHQLHERLYFVRGSPLSMHVFHTARMMYARSILIMSYCGMENTSSMDLENDLENKDENMADVDAITTHRFITEALQNEASRPERNGTNEKRPMPFIVAEMIRPSNVKFLIDRNGSLFDAKAAANEPRQRDLLKDVKFLDSSFFSPLYASGHIYFSNFMDALMGSCSNQQLMIEMVTQLVISGNMSIKMPNRVQRSRHRLTQIPAPERYHFRPYALLDTMTLGIYRSANTATSPQYVLTNPPGDELVTPQDLLFVIK